MRGLLLFVALLVVALSLGAQPPAVAQKAARAKQLLTENKFAEAAVLYGELAKAYPQNPGLLLNHGMALHMAGKDKQAIGPLNAALKIDPQIPPAWLFLGASYLRSSEPAKAIPHLEKFTGAEPRNGEVRRMLVDAYAAIEKPAKALPHWEVLAELEPRNPSVLYGLGRAWEAYAAKQFDLLAKQHAESAYFFAMLGETRSRTRERRAAFYFFRKALERSPQIRGVHGAIAEIYRLEDKPEWALAEEAAEAKLGAPDCGQAPAECLFRQGSYHSALAAARKSNTAHDIYWRVKAANEIAKLTFTKLESLGPTTEGYRFQAELLALERRWPEAVEAWREARRLEPENPVWTRELAFALLENKNYEEAAKLASALLQRFPEDPQLLHLSGDIELAQQVPEKAIPLLEKSVTLEPRNLLARSSLARALMQAGRATDALPHAQAILPLDTDGSLHFQLARAYQAAGKAEEAKRAMAEYQAARAKLQEQEENLAGEMQIAPPL
jgi:predicted Zn-dependent protease